MGCPPPSFIDLLSNAAAIFCWAEREEHSSALSLSLPSATVLMSGSICISLAPAERHVCAGFFRDLTRLQHLSNPRLTHPGLLPQS
jgi:hypothetical protein